MVEKYGGGSYLFPFEHIRGTLMEADVLFGNLEGPISARGTKRGSIYSFRMDPTVASALAAAGFDIVSAANNHMGDYDREALEDTFRHVSGAGIVYAGAGWNAAEAQGPVFVEREGVRIGFLAYSDVGPLWMEAGDQLSGINIAHGTTTVADAVRQASEQADILVVSFHFGDEYKTKSNVRQQVLARAAVDAGADLVIGHHPHVAQEVERYNNGIIAYSLGNFIFDQAFSEDTRKALMLEVTVRNGAIEDLREIPIAFNSTFQPHIAP